MNPIAAESSTTSPSTADTIGATAIARGLSQSIAADDRGRSPRRVWRPVAGVAISLALMGLVALRTDLADVARVLLAAAPIPLALAVVFVCPEVGVRALRWKVLLDAIRVAAYPRVLACLCIGYFA